MEEVTIRLDGAGWKSSDTGRDLDRERTRGRMGRSRAWAHFWHSLRQQSGQAGHWTGTLDAAEQNW